jgi:hypothetical protein
MSRSYPYVDRNTTEVLGGPSRRIYQREKCYNNSPKIYGEEKEFHRTKLPGERLLCVNSRTERRQGNRIKKPLKKKRKEPAGKGWRGIMDIRTELALIPGPPD